jgi:hypothetical protein
MLGQDSLGLRRLQSYDIKVYLLTLGIAVVLIISLTSVPSRFAKLPDRLRSLLAQNVPDLRVELYIPRKFRRFPEHAGNLPEVPEGVILHVVDDDLGPATKVLFAARRYRGQDVNLLYCDDDVDYMPDWASRFLAARRRLPEAVISARPRMLYELGVPDRVDRPHPAASLNRRAMDLRYMVGMSLQSLRFCGKSRVPMMARPPRNWVARSGHADIAQGIGGVLIRPDFIDDMTFAIPDKFFPVDDIWLSGHFARKSIAVWGEQGASRFRLMPEHEDVDPLWQAIIFGEDRAANDVACINYFRETYRVWPSAWRATP